MEALALAIWCCLIATPEVLIRVCTLDSGRTMPSSGAKHFSPLSCCKENSCNYCAIAFMASQVYGAWKEDSCSTSHNRFREQRMPGRNVFKMCF